MQWLDSHKKPPDPEGQKVYYFGRHIGLWVGYYKFQLNGIHKDNGDYVELCPHLFRPLDGGGLVDACDAPYWMPYDESREASGWRPIVPKQYTKDLYDDEDKDKIWIQDPCSENSSTV